MPEFHCHCECSKCVTASSKLQHQSPVALFEKPFTALSIGLYGRLPQITWSASLILAIVFDFFKTCSKPPTLHHTRDSPLGLYSANLEATSFFLMKSGQLARSQFPALRAVCARVLSCWKMNPVSGRWLLEKYDNLVLIYKQNKLRFIKMSLWRHQQYRGNRVLKIK